MEKVKLQKQQGKFKTATVLSPIAKSNAQTKDMYTIQILAQTYQTNRIHVCCNLFVIDFNYVSVLACLDV